MFLSINGPWISLNEVHVRVHRHQCSAKLKTSRMSMLTPKLPLGYQFIMNNSFNSYYCEYRHFRCTNCGHDIDWQIEVIKLNFIFK